MSFALQEHQAFFERAVPIEVYMTPIDGKYTFTKILQKDENFISTKLPNVSFSLNDFLPQNS